MEVWNDRWTGNDNETTKLKSPTILEVRNLIKRMDQDIYTEVILKGDNNYLQIGGGKNNYLVSFVVGNDDDFYTLKHKEQDDDIFLDIVTGGQEAEVPKNIIFNYEITIQACIYFLKYEDKDPSLLWINE